MKRRKRARRPIQSLVYLKVPASFCDSFLPWLMEVLLGGDAIFILLNHAGRFGGEFRIRAGLDVWRRLDEDEGAGMPGHRRLENEAKHGK